MNKVRFVLLTCMAVVLSCAVVLGQEKGMEKKEMKPGGVRGAFLKQSRFVEEQLEGLAGAVPQDKYSWRPMEGVRSIAESFLHAAVGNYLCVTTMGCKLPEGIDNKTLEKSTTDKGKIIDALKKSFASINDCIEKTPESDFNRHVNFFGNDMTILDMIFLSATHQHEVLGQAIAYARTNNVTPPWTAAMQAKEKANPSEKK